jgi:glutamate dehydrogenase (NADP+)
MFGQYKRLRNEFTGVLTGKGITFGGSLIRPEATGYGDVYFAQNMLATKGQSFDGKTVVVSGSGNVAQYAIEKATELGGKVVTASDSSGYIYDADGINPEKLAYIMEIKNVNYGRISDYIAKYPSAKFVAGKRPWEVKCDIALPCATQNELNKEEAEALVANGCICVSEGANMPSTPEAIAVFLNAKILFAPGKASNAGGVATSGLEMSQNSLRLSWAAEEVDERLKKIMLDIHTSCVKYGADASGYVDYVKGANIAGFVKVAEAMLAQGVV